MEIRGLEVAHPPGHQTPSVYRLPGRCLYCSAETYNPIWIVKIILVLGIYQLRLFIYLEIQYY